MLLLLDEVKKIPKLKRKMETQKKEMDTLKEEMESIKEENRRLKKSQVKPEKCLGDYASTCRPRNVQERSYIRSSTHQTMLQETRGRLLKYYQTSWNGRLGLLLGDAFVVDILNNFILLWLSVCVWKEKSKAHVHINLKERTEMKVMYSIISSPSKAWLQLEEKRQSFRKCMYFLCQKYNYSILCFHARWSP